jgi:hypothetical protein
MSLAQQPYTTPQPPPGYVPHTEYKRVCYERDRLRQANARLEQRLAQRQEREAWRRALAQHPTKKLNPTEKDIADDLYATFRGREIHGVDPTAPLWTEGRAAKIGISAATYRTGLDTLESLGVITKTTKRGGNGHTRIIATPTPAFWDATAIAREAEKERDYGYRARRCQAHPNAHVTEIRETNTERITRETIIRTFVCDDCGSILDTEKASKIIGDPEPLTHEVERFDATEVANEQVVHWLPEESQHQGLSPIEDYTEERYTEDGPDAMDELRELPQWVFWGYRERDGKRTKPPYDPATGKDAKCNDPTTWGTFAAACNAMQRYAGVGVGFMFQREYFGVDLDKCRDPETGAIAPWAQDIIDELATYTEISPSLTGVHCIGRGKLPPGGRHHGAVEMYDSGRYFTVTGRHVEGTPATIEDRTEALVALHGRMFPPAPPVRHDPPGLTRDAEEIVRVASNARNGDKFRRLMEGDTAGYTSHSDADLALCGLLAYGRATEDQIDAIFRGSGLYRDKWERADYRNGTIGTAMQGKRS